MAILRHFYPIFRRNSTFLAFCLVGGLAFEQVFNRSTRYYFFEVLNKGNGFNYLEPKLLALQAAKAEEDDE